uniref:Uncharacterized protein n=1 Tax=Leersia perrieri TaxID=77586 RepID=A0A0D9W4D6_9ORYZ
MSIVQCSSGSGNGHEATGNIKLFIMPGHTRKPIDCNKCVKKDSFLDDPNQHMTNVPTNWNTCLKRSSDNTFQLMHGLKLLISGGAAARK